MKFRIRRTSRSSFSKEKPCEDAYLDKFVPDTNDDYFDQSYWAIDIESIEDLLALAEKEKEEIIVKAPCEYTDNLPEIEIYDDYRE